MRYPLLAIIVLISAFALSCNGGGDVVEGVWSQEKEPPEKTLHYAKGSGLEFNAGVPKGGTYTLVYNMVYWQDEIDRQGIKELELTLLVEDPKGGKSHQDCKVVLAEGDTWKGELLEDEGGDRTLGGDLVKGLELAEGDHRFLVYSNQPNLREVFGVMKLGLTLVAE